MPEPAGPVVWVAKDPGFGGAIVPASWIVPLPSGALFWTGPVPLPADFMATVFPDLDPGSCRAYRLVPVEDGGA